MNYSNKTSCGCNNYQANINQDSCGCFDNEMDYEISNRNNIVLHANAMNKKTINVHVIKKIIVKIKIIIIVVNVKINVIVE